ncbi:hypothetical protein QFC24_000722 [Naganishia onofrii]|uniref:Uncharacterized protein n=1 Tax=Naganishia onofrii TaxID=1851511 RepID=A0ACC2XTF3_9TREE|nr:hypothetical protein QFC24_000722 [Naganishia onofrii]
MSKSDDIKLQDMFIEGHVDGSQQDVPYVDKEGHHPSTAPVNILSHLSRAQLLSDVDRFVKEKGLEEHVDDIRKGALLAQNPTTFEQLDELTQSDKERIHHENTHRWSQPMTLYLTIAICSLGSNGANLSFPREFGIAGETGTDPWIVGIVNAAPYLAASIVGCWLSDPLNNYFGRRGTIFLTALCLIASPIASGFTKSWQALFACRLVLGLGMGTKGSTVPVFAAENSPTVIRGALGE